MALPGQDDDQPPTLPCSPPLTSPPTPSPAPYYPATQSLPSNRQTHSGSPSPPPPTHVTRRGTLRAPGSIRRGHASNRRGAVTKRSSTAPTRQRNAGTVASMAASLDASAAASASASVSPDTNDEDPYQARSDEHRANARQTLQAQSIFPQLPVPVDANVLNLEDAQAQVEDSGFSGASEAIPLESTNIRGVPRPPERPPRIRVYYDDRLFGIGKHNGRWLFYDCCRCQNATAAYAPGYVNDGRPQQCAVCKDPRCDDCSQTWMVADRHVEGVGVLPLPRQAMEMQPPLAIARADEMDGRWLVVPTDPHLEDAESSHHTFFRSQASDDSGPQ